jgi:putative 4-mercaptohistidine N1-methyltranferase
VSVRRALDVGCAVGGSSFALARHVPDVVGVDFSAAFVAAARALALAGSAPFQFVVEGDVTDRAEARVPADVDRSRVRFEVGDACALDAALGTFDLVHAANLLCRLPSPAAFLQRAAQLVRRGGLLVLVSPYSWLPQYTPRAAWVGGTVAADGAARRSAAALAEALSGAFELVGEGEEPFVIREHARKFQWGVSHVTVWRRRSAA